MHLFLPNAMLALRCDRCENLLFFVPCDSQLMLQCNLVKTGCCYCATPHPESCLSTGTKINMQLRYTFAFEWIRHWLPVIPVCVYLHLLFILTMMSGFSFVSVVQLMNHSVCRHFVQVLFLEAWIIWGFDWFKKKEKKHTFWVLSFWTHWTASLCRIE